MALRFEELEEFLADFGGFHKGLGDGLDRNPACPALPCAGLSRFHPKRVIIRKCRPGAPFRGARFATNPERVRHRDTLVPIIAEMVRSRGKHE
ncbi:hypothetical protein C9I57_29260 [Trinickia symbiotica]|uniref:Uncharacterized protein n=1 Tax=Trinickia symbiotica TaxID=863227 RepID=A0A2T3XKW1_9BURK|nr:hypothetical protein C9I57_29260 [Trinickia symbiotica]